MRVGKMRRQIMVLTKTAAVLLMTLPLFSFSVAATHDGWQFKAGEKIAVKPLTSEQPHALKTNSQFVTRSNMLFKDDITADPVGAAVKLTKVQVHQALVWGLTTAQEQRYLQLMQNRTGVYYKARHLTPVWILGINARTNKERAFYAAQAAYQDFQKNAKLLAFNAAFNKASETLKEQLRLPMIRPFDVKRFSPYRYQPIALKPGDRLLFFVKVTDAVKPIMATLMQGLLKVPHAQLNIYLAGKALTKKRIEQWATGQTIPKALVNNKTITLNFGNKKLKALNMLNTSALKDHKDKTTPLLLLIRQGKTHQVNLERF